MVGMEKKERKGKEKQREEKDLNSLHWQGREPVRLRRAIPKGETTSPGWRKKGENVTIDAAKRIRPIPDL
jgi:hypothetical protein